MYSQEL